MNQKGYVLNKREVVMKRHERQESDRHVYFQFGEDGNEHREGVYMTRVNYVDMGEPDEITVAITPGNTIRTDGCPDLSQGNSYAAG